MGTTKIEWADVVWNPITGCSWVSEGCDNCYAERLAFRLKGRFGYPAEDPFKVTFHRDRIEDPLRWKRPRKVFVCSMGDLFHEGVPLYLTKEIFDVMRRAGNFNGHTFIVLTKRPKRMAEFIALLQKDKGPDSRRWPMPFVWLGVTAENQQLFDGRWPIMQEIPAAVRFVSIEPMLSKIDLRIVPCRACNHPGDVLAWPCPSCKGRRFEYPDWVICGGETGQGARPVHPDWIRSLRDQCANNGVPFFFKQWGAFRDIFPFEEWRDEDIALNIDGRQRPWTDDWSEGEAHLRRVGKKAGGRMLDGYKWNEFPTTE